MGRIFLTLISIALSFGIEVKAQYASMLSADSCTWYVLNCYTLPCGSNFYKAVDDTIIDGKHYKFLDWYHFNRNNLIREDTTKGHVYFRSNWGFRKDEDVLVYDYSLDVGDTTSVYNPNSPIPSFTGVYRVDSVTTVNTTLGPRKKLILKNTDSTEKTFQRAVWVEGVGGLCEIHMPGANNDRNQFGELSCFYQDTIVVYQSFESKARGQCRIFDPPILPNPSSIDQEAPSRELVIFPNPVGENLQIKAGHNDIKRVRLYDVSSTLVFEAQYEADEVTLDVSAIRSGLFFLKVNTDNGQEFRRTVVIE